jgi:hypothetical protein
MRRLRTLSLLRRRRRRRCRRRTRATGSLLNHVTRGTTPDARTRAPAEVVLDQRRHGRGTVAPLRQRRDLETRVQYAGRTDPSRCHDGTWRGAGCRG